MNKITQQERTEVTLWLDRNKEEITKEQFTYATIQQRIKRELDITVAESTLKEMDKVIHFYAPRRKTKKGHNRFSEANRALAKTLKNVIDILADGEIELEPLVKEMLIEAKRLEDIN